MKRLETGRVCAVCGKRRSPSGQKDTYGFGTILRRNGITSGDKAHRECVEKYKSKLPELVTNLPMYGLGFARMKDRMSDAGAETMRQQVLRDQEAALSDVGKHRAEVAERDRSSYTDYPKPKGKKR